MATDEKSKFRLLVFAPLGKDASLISEVLLKSGVLVQAVSEPRELAQCIRDGADAAIITEEALSEETTKFIGECIASQPPWSDFPLIILTGSGASTPVTEMAARAREALGNLSLLERPGSASDPAEHGKNRLASSRPSIRNSRSSGRTETNASCFTRSK